MSKKLAIYSFNDTGLRSLKFSQICILILANTASCIYESWLKDPEPNQDIFMKGDLRIFLKIKFFLQSPYFYHWCDTAWILLVKNVINSRSDIIWTFQPVNSSAHSQSNICKFLYIVLKSCLHHKWYYNDLIIISLIGIFAKLHLTCKLNWFRMELRLFWWLTVKKLKKWVDFKFWMRQFLSILD